MTDTTTTDTVTKTKRAKTVYNRVIVQLDEQGNGFRIVQDLGPTTTLKAQSAKRGLERAGTERLAIVYWIG